MQGMRLLQIIYCRHYNSSTTATDRETTTKPESTANGESTDLQLLLKSPASPNYAPNKLQQGYSKTTTDAEAGISEDINQIKKPPRYRKYIS